MNTRLVGIVAASIVWAGVARAENQVWNDGGPNNNWSTNEANWGAGAVWTNGNSAIFSGNGGVSTGEVVDIAATVTVANVTFQTNGYVIADANKDGSLSVAGSPSVFTVVNASDTGTMSVSIGGSGGITKAGNGVLSLTTNSAYAGTTTVSAGVLRLARNQPNALGQVGGGNDTVVASGATLDFNGAYVSSSPQEKFTISGSGTDGKGVLINNGAGHVNVGIGAVTMLDDAVIGGSSRIDAYTIYANGHTLTKTGSGQLCVQNVATGTIVISSGQYTLLADNRGLGGTTPGDTYVYGTANLDSWNTMTVNERVFFNGGYVTQGNPNNQLFTLAGYMTLNSNVTFNTGSPTSGVEVAGYMDGNGGFTQAGNGWCYITGNTNTFSGPTIINSGKPLWIGKTVGGTGRLGSGAVTNYGTLYANSAVLGSGEVVNNAGGVLYLSPANLSAGRIVNAGGTVYGTSVVQTASSVVNSGTWQCYSGSFGSSIVTNANGGTLNLYTNVLTYGQLVNGGTLSLWKTMALPDPITFTGGSVYVNDLTNSLYMTGPITVNTSAAFGGSTSSLIEVSGKISGPGGIIRSGDGLCYITGDANDFTGPATINSGRSLWLGKTVGGTGSLGSGAVTNNGTLYANSAALGTGEVVNNSTLYLNPASLNAGRIVNTGAGTVYGTSIVQTVSSVVNSGTWQCYSGSFGSSIVTNASGGTLNLYTNVLTYGQFVNSGTLNILNPMTFTGAMTVNGGTVNFSAMSNTLVLAGPLTLSSNFSLNSVQTSVVELSGKISGPGGLTRSGDGLCFVTGDSNDYTGPTTVNAGKSLWVGKPAGEAAGRLGSGAITNNGALYFDSAGAYTNFNGINGYGVTAIRYGGQVIVSGGVSSNSDFHVANGSLTLTNGAIFSAYSQLTIANRADVKYVVAPTNCLLPTNVFATVTVNNGCALIVKSVTFGNGNDLPGGTMTGILNQVGGVVRTTGAAAEDNGVRLGHYPQARSFYNMMGGTLFVEGNWDLGCATDGEGWFNMTGGEVFTKRVMLNERDYDGGFGRLTVAGGTLNVGSLTGSSMAISNSITADLYARYLVEFGGAGGVVRAVTNLWIPASATLIGTGTNAITFDSQAWTITMTNKLSGTGGLNKAGSGTLVLSGNNTYSGGTAVKEGTLVPAGRFALPNGALTFGVAANGTCGVLHMTNDLSLTGLSVGVVNPEQLDKNQSYTVITYSGALSGSLGSASLPKPWYVYYDWSGNTVQLRAGAGTKIWLK